jgi:hypothetical protein
VRGKAVVPLHGAPVCYLCWATVGGSATSASPERLFSTVGPHLVQVNDGFQVIAREARALLSHLVSSWKMTKQRTRLTCDNLETIVYLHEVWPNAPEWEARKRFKAV